MFCWPRRFDVAGAGACLKRYTDPSFFKAESADFSIKKSEGQREKRVRKVKVLGPNTFIPIAHFDTMRSLHFSMFFFFATLVYFSFQLLLFVT